MGNFGRIQQNFVRCWPNLARIRSIAGDLGRISVESWGFSPSWLSRLPADVFPNQAKICRTLSNCDQTRTDIGLKPGLICLCRAQLGQISGKVARSPESIGPGQTRLWHDCVPTLPKFGQRRPKLYPHRPILNRLSSARSRPNLGRTRSNWARNRPISTKLEPASTKSGLEFGHIWVDLGSIQARVDPGSIWGRLPTPIRGRPGVDPRSIHSRSAVDPCSIHGRSEADTVVDL